MFCLSLVRWRFEMFIFFVYIFFFFISKRNSFSQNISYFPSFLSFCLNISSISFLFYLLFWVVVISNQLWAPLRAVKRRIWILCLTMWALINKGKKKYTKKNMKTFGIAKCSFFTSLFLYLLLFLYFLFFSIFFPSPSPLSLIVIYKSLFFFLCLFLMFGIFCFSFFFFMNFSLFSLI